MKKRLLPIEYEYRPTNTLGGFICILGPFVFLLIVNNTSHPIEISVWSKAAVPIIAFGLIMILLDLIHYKKVRELRKQRDIMMEKTPVPGEIVDIERCLIDWNRKFTDNMSKTTRYVDQLIVSYIDPADGMKKTAKSEYYLENLFTCLSSKKVDVYLNGDNGYAIVDGLHIRKLGEDRITIENHEPSAYDSDISFYLDIYGGVFIPLAAVLVIIIISEILFNVI